MEGLDFDQVEGLERDWIEWRFEKEEVLRVVKELEGDKAPGPDGFSMTFFHRENKKTSEANKELITKKRTKEHKDRITRGVLIEFSICG